MLKRRYRQIFSPGVKTMAVIKSTPSDFVVKELFTESFTEKIAGPHTVYELKKEDIGHFSLLHVLAAQAGIMEHEIGYCGIKDKNAITTQLISMPTASVTRLDPDAVPGCTIKFVGFSDHKLRRGEHCGNAFEVVLRELRPTENEHLATFAGQHNVCYPNYFGAQRFGR